MGGADPASPISPAPDEPSEGRSPLLVISPNMNATCRFPDTWVSNGLEEFAARSSRCGPIGADSVCKLPLWLGFQRQSHCWPTPDRIILAAARGSNTLSKNVRPQGQMPNLSFRRDTNKKELIGSFADGGAIGGKAIGGESRFAISMASRRQIRPFLMERTM